MAHFEKDGRAFVESTDGSWPSSGLAKRPGFSDRALYALEKARVRNDFHTLDGVPWYVRGAEAPPSMPGAGGASSGRGGLDPLGSTAFALLVRLRSSEGYHPTTPRPVDAGRARYSPSFGRSQ